MQKGMERGIGRVAGEWAAPCAGKGCAASWSPRCIPQAGKRAPGPPGAGTYLLCLTSLWSLPFLLGGEILMRLCMPRVPSKWHWRGNTQQLMEETMRLRGGILGLPAQLQCETPQTARWSTGSSLSWSFQSAHAVTSQGTRAMSQHRKCHFRITHLGELSKQCQMFWH